MRNYWNSRDRADLAERVKRVGPDSPRRWGKMNAHQMICHLADAFRGATGVMNLRPRAFGLERRVKWLALYVPAPWPRGYPAPREIDQLAGAGTPPAVFDQDRETLLGLMGNFTQGAIRGRRHPLWGRMSEWEWGRWGYLHTDHHLGSSEPECAANRWFGEFPESLAAPPNSHGRQWHSAAVTTTGRTVVHPAACCFGMSDACSTEAA